MVWKHALGRGVTTGQVALPLCILHAVSMQDSVHYEPQGLIIFTPIYGDAGTQKYTVLFNELKMFTSSVFYIVSVYYRMSSEVSISKRVSTLTMFK